MYLFIHLIHSKVVTSQQLDDCSSNNYIKVNVEKFKSLIKVIIIISFVLSETKEKN